MFECNVVDIEAALQLNLSGLPGFSDVTQPELIPNDTHEISESSDDAYHKLYRLRYLK